MLTIAGRLGAAARIALLVGCGILIALSLAGAISTRADSINIFAPYWLAGTAAALTIILVIEKRRGARGKMQAPAALLAALVGLGGFLLLPLSMPPESPRHGRSYRLISFNMFKANPEPEQVVDWLLSQKADFIVLLEVSPGHRMLLQGLSAHFPYIYDCAGTGRCSTYILSRYPAEEDWPLARGDADNRQALSALTAHFRLDGQVLPITAAHLDRPWPLGDQHRHLGALQDALASVGRDGVVVGDFNSAPWTFAVRRLAEAANVRLVSAATGTWPTSVPWPALRLPLDQLYLGGCSQARSVRSGPQLGSDHLPLIADIVPTGCRG